jgi:hypothetical protein
MQSTPPSLSPEISAAEADRVVIVTDHTAFEGTP